MNIQYNVTSKHLLELSRIITNMLKKNEPVEEIMVMMEKRDQLVLALQSSGNLSIEHECMIELLQLRNEERILLVPFQHELQVIRKSLGNLTHIQQYLSNDL
jgi:hypothetical protein